MYCSHEILMHLGIHDFIFINDFSNKSIGKSIRFYIEPNSLGIIPKLEWTINNHLKIFIQPNFGFNLSGE